MEYSKILGRLLSIREKVISNPRVYMDVFETFEDIPHQHRCFLDLAYWLTQKDRSIEQIPEHARTDRLMFFHLVINPHRFQSITPASKRYYTICEFGMWRTWEVAWFVPVIFITEGLVKRLTAGGSRHAPLEALRNSSRFDHLYTAEIIAQTLKRSLYSLAVMQQKGVLELASLEDIKFRLAQEHHEYVFVLAFAEHLMQQALKEGFWFEPVTPGGNEHFGPEPKSPAEVLLLWERICKTWARTWRSKAEQLCALKMNCFADSEVIKELVNTASGRKFLQRFYSDDRVRVLFYSNQAVRGYILEQELAV